jgi:20S proteasome alpha/beta subunit
MTTIAYRKGVLAADTRMIQGTAIIGKVAKIVRRDDGALCGGAGDCAWVQAFHRWFMGGEEGDPPVIEENSKGLIIKRRKPIEMFEPGGTVEWKPPYLAIGSGKEFALGAMWAGANAIEAVKAAMTFDPGTGGEVMVLTHDKA